MGWPYRRMMRFMNVTLSDAMQTLLMTSSARIQAASADLEVSYRRLFQEAEISVPQATATATAPTTAT